MSRHLPLAVALIALGGLSACAADASLSAPTTGGSEAWSVAPADAGGEGLEAKYTSAGLVSGMTGGESDERGRAGGIAPRLIRTGDVSVVVDTFEPFRAELSGWLDEAGGYVADANLSHHEGRVGWASLTVRVPAERFDALVGWTEEQVQVQSLNLSVADVTAEWVDVEARIENARREEVRLQELLATDAASLADVLAVERELARVRGEIESAEGRMRVLSDQVGYATLQIHVQVNEIYEPYVAASFGDQIVGTFRASIDAMGGFGRGAVLAGVAVAPWLVIPGLGLTGLIGVARRRRR